MKKEIKHKLKEIEENISLVEDNLPEDFDEFKNLGLVKDGIYKRIENSIENIIDICGIINSELKLGIPNEDEDLIENVFNKKIITKKLYLKIKEMKGFRNILVHRYGDLDDQLAFESIKSGIEDFNLFIDEIEKFLEK
ncbi:DUF86 domain-containing protein [Candidatus Woesearchaeota archaeon]|nr:DUF86 domain-containing protein [Candidatus Woesearchaeota archaeon]